MSGCCNARASQSSFMVCNTPSPVSFGWESPWSMHRRGTWCHCELALCSGFERCSKLSFYSCTWQLSVAMMKKPQRGMEDIWCVCGKRAEKGGGDMLGFLWEPPKRKIHENCLDHADIHREVGDLATTATRLATCTDQATPSRPAGKHKLVRKEQRSSHNVTTRNWTKPPHETALTSELEGWA